MNATDVIFHGGRKEIVLFKALIFLLCSPPWSVSVTQLMYSVMSTAVHLRGLITFTAIYLTEKTNDAKDHPVP